MTPEERLKAVLERLTNVFRTVFRYCGEETGMKLFQNYKAVYQKKGECPLSLEDWIAVCKKAKFDVDIHYINWTYDNVVLKCLKR